MAGTGPHVVSGFVGPLSIKTMLRGRGAWRTDDGLYLVEEGHALVLRAGQRYSLDFPVDEPHASFCPCFTDGFVEDVARGEITATELLLDAPEQPGRTPGPDSNGTGAERARMVRCAADCATRHS